MEAILRIGIVIGRIGGVDGVALETEKWITVLKKLGHEVYIATGKLQNNISHVTIIPELDFHHPLTILEQDNAFYKQNVSEDTLIKRVERNATHIEQSLLTWIVKHKIDCILSENASALPCHLAMGIALRRIFEKTGIPGVTHDHDFAWERDDRYKTQYKWVKKVIKDCFPIKLPNVRHAVINSAAQESLKKKLKIDSVVVPNVMDFKVPYAVKDDFNSSLPKSLGLKETDIPLFQITRIVRRKGIETAIKLISELDDPNMKLIVTGSGLDDYNADYFGELIDYVDECGLYGNVLFASNHFANDRRVGKHLASDLSATVLKNTKSKKKRYSLSDAYAYSKACTYFSTYEGFGNAFVECVLAKKPIFVNNYKPVYMPDIGSLGFETVMLNNSKLTRNSIADIKDVLYNSKRAKEIGEYNFKLGKKYFSYEVLERILKGLFSNF